MKVNVIDEFGQVINNIEFDAAVQMAKSCNKDLVLVNFKTNTYKIADAGKLKYEQKQKSKQARDGQRTHKIKEIKLRPNIEQHDLEVKINHIREFMAKGLRTKVIMSLRGRQITHKNLALEKLNQIPNTLIAEGLASIESPPRLEGRDFVLFLIPTKNKQS